MQVLTVRCKLAGSDEDRAAMAATVAAFAAACRFVAQETPSGLVNEARLWGATYCAVVKAVICWKRGAGTRFVNG